MSDNVINDTEPNNDAAAVEPQIVAEPGGDDADMFPRSAVEKLRRESAGYRERANTAESRLSALQRQIAEQQIAAGGMRPAAVFAVAQLDDMLADDGTVDSDKLTAAMAAARDTLGIGTKQRRRNPADRDGFKSGSTTGSFALGPSFKDAFGPKTR